MGKKKLAMGALLALLLTLTAGLPQAAASSSTTDGTVTINGPIVLPPL